MTASNTNTPVHLPTAPRNLASGMAFTLLLLGGCGDKPTAIVPPASAVGSPDTRTVDMSVPLAVVTFSPFTTTAGTPFNVQADGNSGISFELNRPAPPAELKILFDGKPMTGVVVSRTLVTATVPGEYLANAGSYPIEFDIGGIRLPAGTFVVKPR